MTFFDSQRDPVDNSIADTFHWKSTSSTGSSTTILDDLTVPSSPNFPNSTATRYMVNLPGEIYYSGVIAGTHPFVLVDVNSTTILTRVSPTGTLTANTYKIFPADSVTPARVEVHVGTSSVQAGDTLAYDGYFVTSIISSTDMNYINCHTITSSNISANTLESTNLIATRTIDYLSTGSTTTISIKEKIVEIGIWDINASQIKIVDMGTTYCYDIRRAQAIVRNDLDTNRLDFQYQGRGGVWIESTEIWLIRSTASGGFNTTSYSSTTMNRGWIYIDYLV